jgi:predicted CopG family antitoxin
MFKYFLQYYINMVKTLTIKDKVYDELKVIKGKDESFSDLFERMAAKESKGISEFAGFLSEKSAEEMKKSIKEYREAVKKLDDARDKRIENKW